MDPVDLDDLLDRELRALPQPRAPRTLLPRVMAAAARHAAAAPATGLFGWTAWRCVAFVAALVVLGAAAYLVGFGAQLPSVLRSAAEAATDAATATRVFRDVLFEPLAVYFSALAVLFAVTCAAAWAVMEVALGGASQR